MNDLVFNIREELRKDKKLYSVVYTLGPHLRNPHRRMGDVKVVSNPTPAEEQRWTETYALIVAPCIGRYSQALLQELLEGLLPNRQPVAMREFTIDKNEERLKYGSKTFEKKVGEELITIDITTELADLEYIKPGTRRITIPIYQTVGVILCPDFYLASKEYSSYGKNIDSFSISLKDLEKRDPNYKPGLMERLFG